MAGIPGIKEFPSDDKAWRVDWFGALQYNPSVHLEPTFQVIISPIVKPDFFLLDFGKLASVQIVDYDQQKTFEIGVGQLPMICPGSIWRNKEYTSLCAGNTVRLDNVLVTEATTQILSAGAKDDGNYIIPFTHYRLGSAGFHSKVMAVQYNSDPYGILIPMAELVRFYYAVSTDLANVIFSGALKHDIDSVLNTENTWLEPENDRAVIGLRQRFSDEDGWILARIMNSPEAWKGATRVHDEMLKQRQNRKAAHFETSFPFSGETNLVARCKLIPTSDPSRWRYLVMSLVQCSAAFPFKYLTVMRDNDNNRANAETDKPDSEKREGWGNPGIVKGQRGRQFQSQQAPNKNSATEVFNLPTNRFADIEGKKADKPTKAQCNHKSKPKVIPAVKTDELGSAQGESNDSKVGIGRLYSTYERAKALPASFDTFIKAIEYLNTLDGFTAKIRAPDEQIQYIPLTKPEGFWQWSYLDSKTCTRRQIVIGDVFFNNSSFTVTEFEHRHTDKCRIGLIFLPDKKICNKDIHTILSKLAQVRGVWNNLELHRSVIIPFLMDA
ncbi:hypothetical protein [Rheinheimera mangrovi]|uniref:hypothetical protein n=1 Tax=Rheinheimera mangrovi TaxID=2498451 RepID=UPI000F8C90B8|nr:hypothetical protein [Rheinheimera mangrovi]